MERFYVDNKTKELLVIDSEWKEHKGESFAYFITSRGALITMVKEDVTPLIEWKGRLV